MFGLRADQVLVGGVHVAVLGCRLSCMLCDPLADVSDSQERKSPHTTRFFHPEPNRHGYFLLGLHPTWDAKSLNMAGFLVWLCLERCFCPEHLWETPDDGVRVSGLLPGCGSSNHLPYQEKSDAPGSDGRHRLDFDGFLWACNNDSPIYVHTHSYHSAIFSSHCNDCRVWFFHPSRFKQVWKRQEKHQPAEETSSSDPDQQPGPDSRLLPSTSAHIHNCHVCPPRHKNLNVCLRYSGHHYFQSGICGHASSLPA